VVVGGEAGAEKTQGEGMLGETGFKGNAKAKGTGTGVKKRAGSEIQRSAEGRGAHGASEGRNRMSRGWGCWAASRRRVCMCVGPTPPGIEKKPTANRGAGFQGPPSNIF